VQVLISAALVGLVTMALSQVLNNANKGQKNVQNAVDFDLLRSSLNLVFSTKACDGALLVSGAPVTFSFPGSMPSGTNIVPAGSSINIDEIHHGNSTVAKRNSSMSGGMTLSTLAITEAVYDGDQVIGGIAYKAFAALIKVEATKAVGSYGAPKLSTQIGVRLLAVATNGRVEKCAASSASFIPTGTVAAFNLSTCPDGWSALSAAAGRFVVGTGTLGTDTYALASTGGEARHTLSTAEMPVHGHALPWRSAGSGFAAGPYGPPAEYPAQGAQTGNAGGGQAHENRPPYIALLYCQKD